MWVPGVNQTSRLPLSRLRRWSSPFACSSLWRWSAPAQHSQVSWGASLSCLCFHSRHQNRTSGTDPGTCGVQVPACRLRTSSNLTQTFPNSCLIHFFFTELQSQTPPRSHWKTAAPAWIWMIAPPFWATCLQCAVTAAFRANLSELSSVASDSLGSLKYSNVAHPGRAGSPFY